MDDYGEMPVGFGMVLAQNGKALEYYAAMTPGQRQSVLDKARHIRSAEEMRNYVNSLVGWEEGHPPYQL